MTWFVALFAFGDDPVVALSAFRVRIGYDGFRSTHVEMMASEYAFGDDGFRVRMLENTHSEYAEGSDREKLRVDFLSLRIEPKFN